MKLNYKISQLALEDIDSIWQYTLLNWSKDQADKYYLDIFDGIYSICQNPMIGKSVAEIKEHHRRILIGSHMIIYKQENNLIVIDRVLHQRMDIENQLIE